ncbi:MAG: DUF3604 domain-containing protein [Thiocapsa sp.]|nr:DUF3604 domain-containing protein [Thiocapsa sp.]MCG6986406.1 DUF3604 domain-containing protein [Thiocapsa sp.]
MPIARNILADPDGRKFHDDFNVGGQTAAQAMFKLINQFAQGEISPELNYQPGHPAYRRVWDDIVRAAEAFNDPGTFTTYIAFEWTSLVSGNNLHRNVIFRDGAERAGQVEPTMPNLNGVMGRSVSYCQGLVDLKPRGVSIVYGTHKRRY